MKGYIYIDYVNKSRLKYIVGKRYKSEQGIYFKRRVKDFDFSIVLNNCYKFYKIKIYNSTTGGIATDFKIINEIDYRQFLKSSNKKEQILSIYKNHETEVLDEFIKNDDPNKKTIMLESGIDFYLDMLIENNPDGYIKHMIIQKYGRNKDLNRFINNYDFFIRNNVAKIGRHQDLDVLINDHESEVVNEVLSNGRFKDIDKYIDNDIYLKKIINVKIDKYLDYIMKNKKINKFFTNIIINIGRKKDLDYFIENEELSKSQKMAIIRHGHEEHLKILKENDKDIKELILSLKGENVDEVI